MWAEEFEQGCERKSAGVNALSCEAAFFSRGSARFGGVADETVHRENV